MVLPERENNFAERNRGFECYSKSYGNDGICSPKQAFVKEEIKNPPDEYNQSIYKVDKKLTAFGMIVASNNNAAVENISVELPKAIDKDRTGRFSNLDMESDNTYFADVATQLLGEPAWELISAKLGKKSNVKALKDRLWWADDDKTRSCSKIILL